MTRKSGDINFETYVGYQAFSSDMPIHRINKSNWYLKFEKNIPAFFIGVENVYRQMPPLALCQTDIEQPKSLSSTEQLEQTSSFYEKKEI